MRLCALLNEIDCKIIGNDQIEITGLSYDSRKVSPGDLFFCIKGFASDGHAFAKAAFESGASALMVTEEQDLDVPQIVVKDGREAMALISAAFYGNPSRSLRIIGVTGTNGKTSTTYMLKSILEREGSKVGLIGTIVDMIGQNVIHTERTTPESTDLQKLLKDMLDEGVDTVVMEVSSHALVLKRVAGIDFDGAIFTNLTRDHMDFHKDFDDYAQAKSMLLTNAKNCVINIDDAYAEVMQKAAGGNVRTFGIKNPADVTARSIELSVSGSRFVLSSTGVTIPMLIRIPGMFSVYNALGAISMCLMLGVDLLNIKHGMELLMSVAGRFETLDTHGNDYSIILDYAHTPDSLENTLKTAREFAKGRVVSVFGCGGNRDATKRPIMGEISGRLADFSIITSDNPRFEEPNAIIADILPGVGNAEHVVIENRREAIKYAIVNAQKDDVIILAGKGHEDYQEIRGIKHDFDEKKVVSEILNELGV